MTGGKARRYNCRGESMRLHIGRIKAKRGAHLDFSFQESLSSPWDASRARLEGLVDFTGRVSNTGKGYLVEGTLRAAATAVCDRCLEPFRIELVDRVQEEFRPAAGAAEEGIDGRAAQDPDEPEDANLFQGDAFSVDELVRDQLLLALPQKLLCTPGCKGICPRCGANLNKGSCGCPQGDVDPRLLPLMDLLDSDRLR